MSFEKAVDGSADGNVLLPRQRLGEAVVLFVEVDRQSHVEKWCDGAFLVPEVLFVGDEIVFGEEGTEFFFEGFGAVVFALVLDSPCSEVG